MLKNASSPISRPYFIRYSNRSSSCIRHSKSRNSGGAQYADYLRELPRQRELLNYQIKLTKYQLDQFEKANKQSEMLRLPTTIPPAALANPIATAGVMTRSMAAARALNGPMISPQTSSMRAVL